MDLLPGTTDLEPGGNGNPRQLDVYFFASLAECILSGRKLSDSRRAIAAKARSFHLRNWVAYPNPPSSLPDIMDRWFYTEQKKICQGHGYHQGTAFLPHHSSLVHFDLFRGSSFQGRYPATSAGYLSENVDCLKRIVCNHWG